MNFSRAIFLSLFLAFGLLGHTEARSDENPGLASQPQSESSPFRLCSCPQCLSRNRQNNSGSDYRNPGTSGPASGPSAGADYSDLGAVQKGYLSSNLAVAGSGLTAATATGGMTPANFSPQVSNALILPGLLTSANAESALPVNRVFFNYALYDDFQVVSTTAIATTDGSPVTTRQGFNLNRFDVGFEKTLFDGMVSAYVRAPFLYAADNTTSANFDGFGNVSAGFKLLLLHDDRTGNALSTGLTVSAPTADAGQVAVSQEFNVATGQPTTNTIVASVNPTFLQPWVATLLNGDRLFLQNYLGVLVSTDNRIPTSFNSNVAVGYRMFRGNTGRRVPSITPMLNVQTFAPIHNNLFDFPDQVFLTEGLQLGWGNRFSVFGGVVQPLAGPKAFSVGATFGVNLFF